MTVGEKIQAYRKQLGLSQDDVGQKLSVSRQTVSLWENNQTVPTVDNLIRLRQVFGVSADEILGSECGEESSEEPPAEVYRFSYTESELNEVYRLHKHDVYGRHAVFSAVLLLLILSLFGMSAPDFVIGFSFGVFSIYVLSVAKGIRAYNRYRRNNIGRMCESTYEYRFFEKYISVSIYRKNEKIRESKRYYTDIERIQQSDKWIFFQFGGQIFILRKGDLKQNSAFYAFMYKNPEKIAESPVSRKWEAVSALLFASSLLSVLGAMCLVSAVSELNGRFTENMWLFFLLTPVPVSSAVFGFAVKSDGRRYTKNIVVGIVMTVLLCIYGSFAFLF